MIKSSKNVLRVTSGVLKGKSLRSPADGDRVRPTSVRVKSALFDIIRLELPGRTFLDLFSGTGQVGIEAYSNGAKVTLCDVDLSLARENVSLVKADVRFFQGEFRRTIGSLSSSNEFFDFIFADPPYHLGYYEDILSLSAPLLSENGKLILEHPTELILPENSTFRVLKTYRYGSRSLTVLGVES